MKKYKQHIKVVNILLRILYELRQEKLKQVQQSLEDFSSRCTSVTKGHRLFQRAVDKCWYPAAEKIRSRINRNLTDFSHHLEQSKQIISANHDKLPKPGDLVAELLQIEEEFDEFKFDPETEAISVITEPIVLEDISFGEFEIRLYLNRIKNLGTNSPYKIIALEPNPAGSDSDVTHPHVSHEKLCEGDGIMPIRKAIEQGRLCDFFLIIVRILKTYNEGSPYVSLHSWSGTPCHDCGCTVSDDESYYCEECDNDFCDHCSSFCQICSETKCLGCSYECPDCKTLVCKDCLAICSDCNETYCTDCIKEENLCNDCLEQRKEDEDEELEEETTTEPKTVPAIQPDSLGQTRISA